VAAALVEEGHASEHEPPLEAEREQLPASVLDRLLGRLDDRGTARGRRRGGHDGRFRMGRSQAIIEVLPARGSGHDFLWLDPLAALRE
jgi:hypothetical protein